MVRNVNVLFFANCPEPDEFFTKSKIFGMRSKVNDKHKIATQKERKKG